MEAIWTCLLPLSNHFIIDLLIETPLVFRATHHPGITEPVNVHYQNEKTNNSFDANDIDPQDDHDL